MLSRTTNEFIREIYHFRNKEGKIIIVYDNDERLGQPTATTLFQKDIDNVFLLTGGLRRFADEYLELVEGDAPPPAPGTPNSARGTSRGGYAASSVGGTSVASTARTSRSSRYGSGAMPAHFRRAASPPPPPGSTPWK